MLSEADLRYVGTQRPDPRPGPTRENDNAPSGGDASQLGHHIASQCAEWVRPSARAREKQWRGGETDGTRGHVRHRTRTRARRAAYAEHVRFFGGRRRAEEDSGLRSVVEQVLVRELAPKSYPSHDVLRPLDPLRLRAALLGLGIDAAQTLEDESRWVWQGREFVARAVGEETEILDLRAAWPRMPAIERLTDLWRVCNAWNADRVWPTAHVRVDDDGSVVVAARVSLDLEPGVTDGQLDHLLRTAIGSTQTFLDAVDDAFPDPVADTP